MKAAEPATEKDARWSKTQYANLIRYVPSGIYFTRIRVRGKLIIKTLKTASVTVAKLRMADLEKDERKKAENQTSVTSVTVRRCRLTVRGAGMAGWQSETTIISNPPNPTPPHLQRES